MKILLRINRWREHCLLACVRPCHLHKSQLRGKATSPSKRVSIGSTSINTNIRTRDDSLSISSMNRMYSTENPPPLAQCSLHSPKLAALHARLAFSKRLCLETLARTLVDPSADSNPRFNNAALARVGGSIISYFVGEHLLCTYPRLPISVLFAASYAYNGPQTLKLIAEEWGVETAAAPGPEVDPGLLQFSKVEPGTNIQSNDPTTRRDILNYYRRGMTSRLVYDDEFGDKMPREDIQTAPKTTDKAYAGFVNAVVGALYLHTGRQSTKIFVKQHILSRHLDISTLFQFQNPIRELARLCNREGFELPIARIISETGRWSRAPVYVVGIFSGKDLLASGSGPSLPEARIRACVAALKSWYLYSPGKDVNVPSDTEGLENTKQWKPVYIDPGEIVLS